MKNRWRVLSEAAVAVILLSHAGAHAQSAASAPVVDVTSSKLFAIEFKVGPRWVASKAPHEQENFREHSANLRRLREQGSLVLGARYGDKGLVVLAAESENAARVMVEEDASVKAGVFSYEIAEFSVFYGGSVQPRKPKP